MYNIVIVIGVDLGLDDLLELCYGKICILVDVDLDGLYIVMLLCVLFVKYFLILVEEGYLYVVMLLLYWIDDVKDVYYVLDDDEFESMLKKCKIKNL